MKRLERGQTLIIALIIMGALLTIGLTLSGIIGSHLHNTVQSRKKSLAEELADSGILCLHKGLIENGADWQPFNENEYSLSPRDPDYFFLKPGGPDDKGSYIRISMNRGRALIRVRWVNKKEEANKEEYGTRIDLSRYPGCMLLESIGRSGKIDSKDPTTLLSKPITQEEFYTQEARLKIETVKRVALVPLLILENLFTITNKDRQTRASEMGYPSTWRLDWEWLAGTQSWSNGTLEVNGRREKEFILDQHNQAIRIVDKPFKTNRLEPPLIQFNKQKNDLKIESGDNIDRGDQALLASLPQDWIHHTHSESTGWIGSYYFPSCVRLVFDRDGFVVHRDIRNLQNLPAYERYFIRKNNNKLYFQSEGSQEYEFSGVISVNGDVGIKGVHPSQCPLTVMSTGTIYIEGSLVKSQQSKMALLAKNYICVNPTLLFAPKNNLFDMTQTKYGEDTVFELNRPEEDLVFNVFLDEVNKNNNPKFVLLYKNRPQAEVQLEDQDTLSLPEVNNSPQGRLFTLEQSDIFKNQTQDQLNQFVNIRVFQKFEDSKSQPLRKPENYHFIRAAVLPYHVRIQASAYSEKGSFFVIPGPQFNPYIDDPLPIIFEWQGSLAQNLTARWDQQELWLHRWCRTIDEINNQKKSRWTWIYDELLLESDRKEQNTGCQLPPFAGFSVSKSKLYYGEDRS